MGNHCKYALIFSTFLQSVIGNQAYQNFEESSHIFVAGMYDVYMSNRASRSIHANVLNANPTLTEYGFGPDYPVPLARHHIIPCYTLHAFYNKLIYHDQYHKLSQFWSSFGEQLPFYVNFDSSDSADWNTIIQGVYKLLLGFRFNLIIPADQSYLCPPFFEEFQWFYSGLPGNLFIGPANRVDDPRNKFEINAASLIGRRRYRLLLSVYNLMTEYLAGRDDIDWEKLEDNLIQISRFREPMRLLSDQWVRTKDGRYYIRNTSTSYYDRRPFERDIHYDFRLGDIIDQGLRQSIYYKYLEKSVIQSLYSRFSDARYVPDAM